MGGVGKRAQRGSSGGTGIQGRQPFVHLFAHGDEAGEVPNRWIPHLESIAVLTENRFYFCVFNTCKDQADN